MDYRSAKWYLYQQIPTYPQIHSDLGPEHFGPSPCPWPQVWTAFGAFLKCGVPQNGWFIMEHPMIYNGKSYWNGWFEDTPIHIAIPGLSLSSRAAVSIPTVSLPMRPLGFGGMAWGKKGTENSETNDSSVKSYDTSIVRPVTYAYVYIYVYNISLYKLYVISYHIISIYTYMCNHQSNRFAAWGFAGTSDGSGSTLSATGGRAMGSISKSLKIWKPNS